MGFGALNLNRMQSSKDSKILLRGIDMLVAFNHKIQGIESIVISFWAIAFDTRNIESLVFFGLAWLT